MLCKGPVRHDKSSNHKKDVTSDSLCSYIEAYPLIYFCCVVCTCHNVEQKPLWDLISPIPLRAPQFSQQNMTVEVTHLTQQTKCKPNLHLKVTNRAIKWVINIICNIRTKRPVVSAVSKHIRKRWGRVAEPMDEKCFHDSFEVVKTPVVHCIRLNRMDDTFGLVAEELIDREVVKDGVEDQGAQVFKKEESAIRNLWTQVLEDNSYVVWVVATILSQAFLVVKNGRPLLWTRLNWKS